MTAKGIIVALSVVAVLGALAAMVALAPTATPTAAQGQPQPEEPPSTPTSEPVTEADAETLATMKQYCHDGFVHQLYAVVVDADGGTGKTVSLEWWPGPSDLGLPEEMVAYYRIERQSHGKEAPTGDQWQVVATVHTTNVWEGPVETGHWHYRVRLIGLVSGDLIHECETTPWAESIVNVLIPQEELERTCETAYVRNLTATVTPSKDGQGETVTLQWDLRYDYEPPEGTVHIYEVERKRSTSDGGESSWEPVVVMEVYNTETWTGPGSPGGWIYRVALVSLRAGDLAAQCEKPRWGQVEVWVPTAEERGREKEDRRILIAEATTCATDTLTENLSPAATDVVARHVKERVNEIVADIDDTEQLLALTVLFCADGEVVSGFGITYSAQMYVLLVLFG